MEELYIEGVAIHARLHAGRSDGAQGESIPPGRRAPPRPSRNDSEEPAIRVRPNLANVIRPPHTSTRNQAERLVQLSPPRRDPDDRPLPAPRAQRRGLLLEARDRRRIDASIVRAGFACSRARDLGTLEGSAQLGTRNSSQAVRGMPPTSLTLRGAQTDLGPPGLC
jgi:hypothetical protein